MVLMAVTAIRDAVNHGVLALNVIFSRLWDPMGINFFLAALPLQISSLASVSC